VWQKKLRHRIYANAGFILDGIAASTPYFISYGGIASDGKPTAKLTATPFVSGDSFQQMELDLTEDSQKLDAFAFHSAVVAPADQEGRERETVGFIFGSSDSNQACMLQLRFKYAAIF
jgi:hypothetical protein